MKGFGKGGNPVSSEAGISRRFLPQTEPFFALMLTSKRIRLRGGHQPPLVMERHMCWKTFRGDVMAGCLQVWPIGGSVAHVQQDGQRKFTKKG